MVNADLSVNWLVVNTLHNTHLTALFPGLPGWAGTRKVRPIWILLKQETVSSSGISWAICKSAPHYRQITMPAPHHSVFYRLDALPPAQPTVSKHWRHFVNTLINAKSSCWVKICECQCFFIDDNSLTVSVTASSRLGNFVFANLKKNYLENIGDSPQKGHCTALVCILILILNFSD